MLNPSNEKEKLELCREVLKFCDRQLEFVMALTGFVTGVAPEQLRSVERRAVAQKYYQTWAEVEEVLKNLEVKNAKDYKEARKKDKRLPMRLRFMFQEFPGWAKWGRSLKGE